MERLSLLSLWTASFLLLAVSPLIILDARAGTKDSEKCDFRDVGLKAGGTSEPKVRLKHSSGGANRRAASIAVQDEDDLPGETNTQRFSGRLRNAENSDEPAHLVASRVGKQKAPLPADEMQGGNDHSGQGARTHEAGEGHGGPDRHLRIPRTSFVSESYPLEEVIVTDPVSRLQVETPRFDVKMQSGKDRSGQGARTHEAGEGHGGPDRHLRIPRTTFVSESYPLEEVIVTDPVSGVQVETPRFDVKMQSGKDRSGQGARTHDAGEGHGDPDRHLKIPLTSFVSESYPLEEVIVTDPVSGLQVETPRFDVKMQSGKDRRGQGARTHDAGEGHGGPDRHLEIPLTSFVSESYPLEQVIVTDPVSGVQVETPRFDVKMQSGKDRSGQGASTHEAGEGHGGPDRHLKIPLTTFVSESYPLEEVIVTDPVSGLQVETPRFDVKMQSGKDRSGQGARTHNAGEGHGGPDRHLEIPLTSFVSESYPLEDVIVTDPVSGLQVETPRFDVKMQSGKDRNGQGASTHEAGEGHGGPDRHLKIPLTSFASESYPLEDVIVTDPVSGLQVETPRFDVKMQSGKDRSGQGARTHNAGEGHGGPDRHLEIPLTSFVSESYPLEQVIVTDPVSALQVETPRFDVKMQSGKDRRGQGARTHDAGEGHGGPDRHLEIPLTSFVSESYPLEQVIVTDPVSALQVETPRFDVKMQSGKDRSGQGARTHDAGEGHGGPDRHLEIPLTSFVSESYPLEEVIVTDPVSGLQVETPRFDVKMQSGKDRNGQDARTHDAGEGHGGPDRHLEIPLTSLVSESYPLEEVIVTDPVSGVQVKTPRFDVKMQSGKDRNGQGARTHDAGESHGGPDRHLRPQVEMPRDIFGEAEEGGVSGDESAVSSRSTCCSGSRTPDSVTFTGETEPARESSGKPAETAGRNSPPGTFKPDNFAIMVEDGLPSVLDLLSDMLSKAEEGRLPRDESQKTPFSSTPLVDRVVMLNGMESTGTRDASVLKLLRVDRSSG